ncbi:MAG: UPF0158 family protein [Bacteroidetes bacterium]|nr:UPF0158 family protein [Bacteroidota bacterium]MBU1116143.1 UPF0158 family protein [Bacteroidota bacterium]MBU1800435.1 UPF0158 family protein [Bacteroidota bacterium]
MKLTDEQIKEIAEELDCGMVVYVHKETKEIKTILDFDSHVDADEELWEEDSNEIEENIDMYFQFSPMDSRASFKIMELFTENVEDEELKKKLELGLSLSKPFRNFKDILDFENEYRDKWFKYKSEKYIEYVKELLTFLNGEDWTQ